MSRILEILTIQGNTLPIRFISHNPHSFKLHNETCRITQKQTHSTWIDTTPICTTTFTSPFRVNYLFYTSYNSIPVILNDSEYYENFKQFVEL